jgi:hypothetical protein
MVSQARHQRRVPGDAELEMPDPLGLQAPAVGGWLMAEGDEGRYAGGEDRSHVR